MKAACPPSTADGHTGRISNRHGGAHFMKYLKRKIFVSLVLLLSVPAAVSADTTIYDKHYDRRGYEKESGATVVMYDKNWNRTGYQKDGRIYDKNWNLQGYKKKGGTTVIYDKQWNRAGYEKDNKIHDKQWNLKGYRKR